MFTIDPFSELSEIIPVVAIQAYVVAMAILVIGGTLLDTMHKKSAKWFFENSERAKENATRSLSSSDRRGHCCQNRHERNPDIVGVFQPEAQTITSVYHVRFRALCAVNRCHGVCLSRFQ